MSQTQKAIESKLFKIIRNRDSKTMRRERPCGIVINSGSRRVYECYCCGASISMCNRYRMPVRVRDFLIEHNDIAHVMVHIEFGGSLAGMVPSDIPRELP